MARSARSSRRRGGWPGGDAAHGGLEIGARAGSDRSLGPRWTHSSSRVGPHPGRGFLGFCRRGSDRPRRRGTNVWGRARRGAADPPGRRSCRSAATSHTVRGNCGFRTPHLGLRSLVHNAPLMAGKPSRVSDLADGQGGPCTARYDRQRLADEARGPGRAGTESGGFQLGDASGGAAWGEVSWSAGRRAGGRKKPRKTVPQSVAPPAGDPQFPRTAFDGASVRNTAAVSERQPAGGLGNAQRGVARRGRHRHPTVPANSVGRCCERAPPLAGGAQAAAGPGKAGWPSRKA